MFDSPVCMRFCGISESIGVWEMKPASKRRFVMCLLASSGGLPMCCSMIRVKRCVCCRTLSQAG